MDKDQAPQIVSDALYGINIRPQELDLYKEYAQFNLRYSPIFDDPSTETDEHFKLLVIEITCQLPPDIELGRSKAQDLDLLRCGWQLQLKTPQPIRVDAIAEMEEELPMLLKKVAVTVKRLADDAGIDDPMPEEAQQRLIDEYRKRHGQHTSN